MADIGMKAAAQMACCKDGHNKCPMHGTAGGCCKSEGQHHQQVSSATHEVLRSVVSPPAILATPLATLFVPRSIRLSPSRLDRPPLEAQTRHRI